MKKTVLFTAALFCLTLIFFSCDKSETYADKLNAQTDAINRFINENNIVVTDNFPTDGVFPENVYYSDPQLGVLFRVISWGDKEDLPKINKTDVSLKYYNVINLSNMDTVGPYWTNDTQDYVVYPITARYQGIGGSYTQQFYDSDKVPSSNYFKYVYLSPGTMRPLDYNIGNGAEVSIIVPFTCGSYVQANSLYHPFFYKRLKYIFL